MTEEKDVRIDKPKEELDDAYSDDDLFHRPGSDLPYLLISKRMTT